MLKKDPLTKVYNRRYLMDALTYYIENKDLLDNEVGEFFKFFKELADTNIYKIKLANAFKEHYIANNKWDNQKKKQGDKVQYIKQVLGE